MPGSRDLRPLLFIILAIYLLARVPLMAWRPLLLDETLYALDIQEMIMHPTAMPSFLGQQVGWKPPLFFWVYAPQVSALEKFGLPLEISFRLPTLVFGMANVLMLWFITRRLYENDEAAFFTALIYSGLFLVAYADASVYIDTFNLSLILAALCCYVKTEWGGSRYLAAGAFAFLAFFTKLWVALMIPVLALGWAFFHRREALKDRLFLLSLLAVPLAFLAYGAYTSMFLQSMVQDLAPGYTIGGRMISAPLLETLGMVAMQSVGVLVAIISLWAGFFALGLLKNWKAHPFMALWAAMLVFPAFSAYQLPWYYLPALPPVAFFSALLISSGKREGPDAPGIAFCLFALIAAFAIGAFVYGGMERYSAEREAGKLMAGHENVLVAGDYGATVVAYKALTESASNGSYLDFGWIVPNDSDLRTLDPFLEDYDAASPNSSSSILDAMPPVQNPAIFRKNTSISRFDYVVLVGFENASVDGEQIYAKSGVRVFRASR